MEVGIIVANLRFVLVFQKFLCFLHLIIAVNCLTSIRWVWGLMVRSLKSFLHLCLRLCYNEYPLSRPSILCWFSWCGFPSGMLFLLLVRMVYSSYLFKLVVLLLWVCAFCYHCLCCNHVLPFRSIHLVNCHYQGRTYFPMSSFPGHLHLLHHPCF